MTVALVLLFTAAAVLPIFGLARLYLAARKAAGERKRETDARGSTDMTFGDLNRYMETLSDDLLTEDRSARLVDLMLIGGGLVCGAVASIWDVLV